jgi:hypothetical protein
MPLIEAEGTPRRTNRPTHSRPASAVGRGDNTKEEGNGSVALAREHWTGSRGLGGACACR